MEELKKFFTDNGAVLINRQLYLQVKDYEFCLNYKHFCVMIMDDLNTIIVESPSLDQVKALIYGVTGVKY